ncbi:hypothetical protein [Mesorhizobium amorphae]|uniref:hypothetical protein n=1 Tax=Mesorhizobium amorphae TaxID=71433 RepID=UPI0011848641|nr:hypothetical protein [Mesorhizobium amorphae]
MHIRTAGSQHALLFFVCFSLFLALLVAIARLPFHAPSPWVPAYYALVSVSAMGTYCAMTRSRLPEPLRSGLSVCLVLLSLAVPFFVSFAGIHALAAVAAMAVISTFTLVSGLRRVSFYGAILAIAFAALFAGYCFLTINTMGYATVLSPENALAGTLRQDTLYHAAIASMFQRFGVFSTGLDGIPWTRYHILTHMWLGEVGAGVGLNAVFGYFLGNQIVFIPMMYFSLAMATGAMASSDNAKSDDLTTTIVPVIILSLVGLWDWNSYLFSESHAASLFLVLLGLPFLLAMTEQIGRPISTSTLLIGCLIGLTACAAKVSAGGVFLVGFLYLLFRSRRLTLPQYGLLVLFGALLLWVLRSYLLPAAHEAQSQLAPLNFARLYPDIAIVNLAIILVAAAVCTWRWLDRKNRAWQETLLLMLATSAGLGMLLKLDGGSAYYFLNLGSWIATAITAATIAGWLKGELKGISILVALGIALVLMGADMLHRNTLGEFKASFAALPRSAAGNPGPTAEAMPADSLQATPLGRLVATIEKGRKDGTLPIVMIEPKLWDRVPYRCPSAPFFIPAYTGLPLLLGVQSIAPKCELGPYYSFPDYNLQAPAPDNLADDKICALARARGFVDVLHVKTLDDAQTLDCR